MGGSITGNMYMIKNKGMGSFNGQMAGNIKEIGRTESSMGKEFWSVRMERKHRENGRRAKI